MKKQEKTPSAQEILNQYGGADLIVSTPDGQENLRLCGFGDLEDLERARNSCLAKGFNTRVSRPLKWRVITLR